MSAITAYSGFLSPSSSPENRFKSCKIAYNHNTILSAIKAKQELGVYNIPKLQREAIEKAIGAQAIAQDYLDADTMIWLEPAQQTVEKCDECDDEVLYAIISEDDSE